jgi:hypothetical protein
LFEGVPFLDEVHAAEHDLVIDFGESGDDLEERGVFGVVAVVLFGEHEQDGTVEVERVLEIGDFVLQLIGLLAQFLLQVHNRLCDKIKGIDTS